MQTIVISSFQSLISRNILSTPVLSTLAKQNIRVVLVCPKHKSSFFKKEFGRAGVIIEGVENNLNWRDNLLRYLALAAITTRTLGIKRRTELAGRGRLLSLFISNMFGRRLIRGLASLVIDRAPFADILLRYKPTLVFSTDAQNELDIRLVLAARDLRISVISMVRSWDNLTGKGLLRVIPEKILVNNEILKEEAEKIHEVLPQIIEIIGIPHHDFYLKCDRTPRSIFFEKIGADPNKKTLLLIPTGDRYIHNNTVDGDILDIVDKNLPSNFQIIVRLPPADRVRSLENIANTARVIFDRSDAMFDNIKDTEISRESDIHLADSLYHTDIVISGPSTMCIDACVFDKPVIAVGFDGYETRDYFDSVKKYYDYDHLDTLLKIGGVKYARDPKEFISLLARYVENPTLDAEKRKEVVQKECFAADGRSSQRLVSALLKYF